MSDGIVNCRDSGEETSGLREGSKACELCCRGFWTVSPNLLFAHCSRNRAVETRATRPHSLHHSTMILGV